MIHLHKWITTAKVSVPAWDMGAKGLLQKCIKCEKVRAK